MDVNVLTREQVKSVIEGRSTADRIPMMIHFWTSPDTFDGHRQYGII